MHNNSSPRMALIEEEVRFLPRFLWCWTTHRGLAQQLKRARWVSLSKCQKSPQMMYSSPIYPWAPFSAYGSHTSTLLSLSLQSASLSKGAYFPFGWPPPSTYYLICLISSMLGHSLTKIWAWDPPTHFSKVSNPKYQNGAILRKSVFFFHLAKFAKWEYHSAPRLDVSCTQATAKWVLEYVLTLPSGILIGQIPPFCNFFFWWPCCTTTSP